MNFIALLFTPSAPGAKPFIRNLSAGLLLCFIFLFAGIAEASAQLPVGDTAEDTQEEPLPEWADDSLGRRSPRGTVYGFVRAVADKEYERAALYLNLNSDLEQNRKGARLAEALQRLLDQSGELLPYSWLSNEYEGRTDDELGPNLDRIGRASLNGEEFDLFVERTEDEKGAPVWLFSSQTVQRLPLPAEEVSGSLIDKFLPSVLKERSWGGVPIGHWLAIVVFALLAYLLARALVALLLFLIPKLWRKAREEATAGVLHAFGLPLRLYLAVWLFVLANEQMGISILVRLRLSSLTLIVGLIAFLLLLARLVDVISRLIEKRLARRNNQAGVSAVLFVKRGAKIALIVIGIILILDTFGFDVTTGLAALGIGGIALALGAQKTVENFVGSVMLIADQPVRVGDFCKVGDIVGTVEQIGMRSTRIRTLNRTLVTIPNGEFSSLSIENYAHRDRFLFNPTLGLRYETTPDQIRLLSEELRSAFAEHPNLSPAPPRIRLVELGSASLNLEIFGYILAKDYDEFLEVKEGIILRIMEVVGASGTDFAFPSQTLYFARDMGVSEEKMQKASEILKQRREEEGS